VIKVYFSYSIFGNFVSASCHRQAPPKLRRVTTRFFNLRASNLIPYNKPAIYRKATWLIVTRTSYSRRNPPYYFSWVSLVQLVSKSSPMFGNRFLVLADIQEDDPHEDIDIQATTIPESFSSRPETATGKTGPKRKKSSCRSSANSQDSSYDSGIEGDVGGDSGNKSGSSEEWKDTMSIYFQGDFDHSQPMTHPTFTPAKTQTSLTTTLHNFGNSIATTARGLRSTTAQSPAGRGGGLSSSPTDHLGGTHMSSLQHARTQIA
jgi:hypothetical protein